MEDRDGSDTQEEAAISKAVLFLLIVGAGSFTGSVACPWNSSSGALLGFLISFIFGLVWTTA